MSSCGAEHPVVLGVICERAPGNHPEHTGTKPPFAPAIPLALQPYRRPEWFSWPNESYKPPPGGPGAHKGRLKELASQVPPEKRLTRSDDPGAAHEAIKTYSRTRYKTRLGKVANFFLNHLGEWHDAVRFVDEEVGGFAGTRRVRELREEYGWDIEIRKHPDLNKPNTHQYRLARLPEIVD